MDTYTVHTVLLPFGGRYGVTNSVGTDLPRMRLPEHRQAAEQEQGAHRRLPKPALQEVRVCRA